MGQGMERRVVRGLIIESELKESAGVTSQLAPNVMLAWFWLAVTAAMCIVQLFVQCNSIC